MRRAVRVHVLQGLRQLLQHRLAPGHVGGLHLEPLAQVAALVERELQVGDGRVARLLKDCLQRGNVRVTQPGKEADLLAQLVPLLGIAELVLLEYARLAVKDSSAHSKAGECQSAVVVCATLRRSGAGARLYTRCRALGAFSMCDLALPPSGPV